MTPQRRAIWFAAAFLVAAMMRLLPVPGQAGWVLAILGFAMVLWVGEALPLAVTGLAASLALILVAGMDARPVFAAYFDPIIVLLLGGFFLGVALSKHGLDVLLASWVMRRAGGEPKWILLALMVTTATFSMWISNTAATAIMLPIALGIVVANPGAQDNLARAFVLGIAFSANLGGISTPIGTTANPIALRFLADAGAGISFVGWVARALPLVAIMIVALWFILRWIYPIGTGDLRAPQANDRINRPQWLVMGVFLTTVALWLTTDIHGVSASVVAVVPIVLLAVIGLVDEKDIHKVGWPTLLLVGGGLALGDAVTTSGLDKVFAQGVADIVGTRGGVWMFAVIAVVAVAMTLVASNTAAAVIMIPIVIQLATTWGLPLQGITMLAAVALSLDFLVPVGTPPNAMAYGTGHVNVAQMAKAGAGVTVVGVIAATGLAYWLW